MDGNGKDGVDAIPRFIEKLEEGYDLVQGSRFMPGGHHAHTPKDRLFGIKRIVAPAVRHASGYPFTDPTNGFRGLSMRLIEHAGMDLFRPCFVRFNFQLYLLCRAPRLGLKVCEIPVTRNYPADGTVPTKIVKARTKALFFWELFQTVRGRYDPPGGRISRKVGKCESGKVEGRERMSFREMFPDVEVIEFGAGRDDGSVG